MSAAPLRIRWPLLLAALCALALIVWLRRHQPSYEEKMAPITVHGSIGQAANARNFSVTVKRLKLARAYRVDGQSPDAPSRVIRADGIWLSAVVEASATQEPGFINARLRSRDGRVYVASGGQRPPLPGVNLGETQLLTGVPATGAYFFDIAEDALPGATLQFHWGLTAPNALDHLLDIDLGLDAAAVQKLRAGTVDELDMRTRSGQ